MDENRDDKHREPLQESKASHLSGWIAGAIVLLVIITACALIYGYRQQATVSQLASHNSEMASTVNAMQDQVSTLTSKLNEVSAAQAAATAANNPSGQPAEPSAATKRRAAAQAKRMKQMETQLDDQGKQLKDTQESLAQARTDLEGNLNSTRQELNGSIARTHEELVALEQRGERNYYEFDVTKSKSFQRTGPISVSLRKADPKHRSFDMMLLVDDNPLSKRNVDLYEPIWISSESAQLQIVVNKVDKNHVHGYVSAPKYPQARVVSTSASGPGAQGNGDTPTSPSDRDHSPVPQE
jgi:ribosomal protein L12E/L44/L45/RPP1/RPP2